MNKKKEKKFQKAWKNTKESLATTEGLRLRETYQWGKRELKEEDTERIGALVGISRGNKRGGQITPDGRSASTSSQGRTTGTTKGGPGKLVDLHNKYFCISERPRK